MEGRDIGTAVFPDAEVKIFSTLRLRSAATAATARPSHRTPPPPAELRRARSLPTHHPDEQRLAEEAILQEMKERDYRDRNRAESPLQPAADAVILDSTSHDSG